ncbi:MAG: hypothetical protein HRF43_12060 [Phycisphaerae bacterium]|jgi:MSHA pilin protein MshD
MSLVEVAVSMLIVGVGLTAGVQALGSFAAGSRAWQERSVAAHLAAQLMAEINALPFQEPGGAAGTIGRESGETALRTTFDDIDDWDGWNQSPPVNSWGSPMSEYTGYCQQVSVTFDTSLATRTGLTFPAGAAKKITVTVLKDGKTLARVTTIRTLNNTDD